MDAHSFTCIAGQFDKFLWSIIVAFMVPFLYGTNVLMFYTCFQKILFCMSSPIKEMKAKIKQQRNQQVLFVCLFFCLRLVTLLADGYLHAPIWLWLVHFRVIITPASTTGKPCPNVLTETKPCPSSPCYKWSFSSWTCDLQVSNDHGTRILISECFWIETFRS